MGLTLLEENATLNALDGMKGAIDEPILSYTGDQFIADDVSGSGENEHFQGAAFTFHEEGGIGTKPAWFGRDTAVLSALGSTASPVT